MQTTRIVILLAACALAPWTSWAQVVPMSNDECTAAIAVSPGINPAAPAGLSGHVYSNLLASTSSSPASAGCSLGGNDDVWFSYSAPVTGLTTISTCTPAGFFLPGSLIDTVVDIYEPTPVSIFSCTFDSELTCNDDACGSRSSVSFVAFVGTTYRIRIWGAGGSNGTFYVVVTPPLPPPNDECSGAIALASGSNGLFSNAFATSSSGAASSCGAAGSPGFRDLWFSLTTCGTVRIDTCNGVASFDTILQVYDACGGNELACNDDTGGTCSPGSTVTLTATVTTTYIVRVSARDFSQTGSFPINVTPINPSTLALSSPLGPGSVRADLSGPLNGTYFLAATVVAGAFPNGWLFGLDISYAELAAELAAGFPYAGPLGACGTFTLGPFQGLPPGVTIYAIVFGFAPGSPVPSAHSQATSYAIP